jgi:hypothetical protein
MKKLLCLIAISGIFTSTYGQTFQSQSVPTYIAPARGSFNALIAFGSQTGQNCTIVTGTVTACAATSSHSALDTLSSPVSTITGYGTDSGYVFWSLSSRSSRTYDLTVKQLSGTLAGAAILQGSRDGVNWYTLTGNTTYCTGCTGASATLSGSGTTHYEWFIPLDGDGFLYHQVRIILSGTCTATFSAAMTADF